MGVWYQMKPVSINAPVSSFEAARKAIGAGADEIYCGVRLKGIKHVTFNGRPSYGSLIDFAELTKVTEYAHARNCKVNFVLNLPFMADILEILAKPHIRQAVKSEVDSFIVADLGLILLLEQMKVKTPIHIGSFATVRNQEAISFYSQFNVARVVAPPDTTLKELSSLVNNPYNIEIEAFIHGQGCSNVNGNCYLSHSYKKQSVEFPDDPLWKLDNDKSFVSIGIRNPCMFTFQMEDWKSDEKMNLNCLNSFPFCSLCYLPDLLKTNVSVLKIEGRCQPIEYQERVPGEYAALIKLLESDDMKGYEKYLENLKRTTPELHGVCRLKKCFYEREGIDESVSTVY